MPSTEICLIGNLFCADLTTLLYLIGGALIVVGLIFGLPKIFLGGGRKHKSIKNYRGKLEEIGREVALDKMKNPDKYNGQ